MDNINQVRNPRVYFLRDAKETHDVAVRATAASRALPNVLPSPTTILATTQRTTM